MWNEVMNILYLFMHLMIATRYDKLASNFVSAIALVAVVIWWAGCVWTLDQMFA